MQITHIVNIVARGSKFYAAKLAEELGKQRLDPNRRC